METSAYDLGPPPFGDGNRASLAWLTSLQWGHRLSAMETSVLHTPFSRRPSLGYCFNGATAFRRWKPAQVRLASMGPPPFGDGNAPLNMIRRFNGATAFRRWKPLSFWPFTSASMGPPPFGDGNRGASARGMCGSFNGATAFRRWKRLFVARLRHGFMQKRSFPEESVTG